MPARPSLPKSEPTSVNLRDVFDADILYPIDPDAKIASGPSTGGPVYPDLKHVVADLARQHNRTLLLLQELVPKLEQADARAVAVIDDLGWTLANSSDFDDMLKAADDAYDAVSNPRAKPKTHFDEVITSLQATYAAERRPETYYRLATATVAVIIAVDAYAAEHRANKKAESTLKKGAVAVAERTLADIDCPELPDELKNKAIDMGLDDSDSDESS